jgi:arylsulfatase A-like enzyme
MAAPAAPNVVIIFADDLGYGDLGSYGNPVIRTPNLDRMAAEGQRWTSFYVAASVCTPSRAGLLTGRHPLRSGVMGARPRVFAERSLSGLPASELTIAELLAQKGYATGMVGKWHLGHMPGFLPGAQGFQFHFGLVSSNDHNRTYDAGRGRLPAFNPRSEFWDIPLMRNGQVIEKPAQQETLTRRYTEEAVRFIDEHHEGPFFLYFAHTFPHTPLFRSEMFKGRSPRGIFGDVVEELDSSAGRVIEALQRNGVAENTLVVFTSDNGPGALATKRFDSNGPLRGVKRDLYEGGIREPFIARWPGRIEAGKTSDAVFTFWDMLPSFAELTGQPIPEGIDGVSVLMAMLGEGPVPDPDRVLYWEFHERGFQQAVRWRDWKGVRQELGGPVEVYDLAADPGEEHDLAASKPDIAAKLGRMIDEARTPSPYWPKKR